MVMIRFPDSQAQCKAVGYLAGRFSFKSWSNGDMLVPEPALPHLAVEGIQFSVIGPATYQ